MFRYARITISLIIIDWFLKYAIKYSVRRLRHQQVFKTQIQMLLQIFFSVFRTNVKNVVAGL